MNEWVGRTLGKVHINSLIARGGMAEVYLGTHTSLQRQVAVKILRNQYEDDPDLLERFQREARVVAQLRHQNIVQVFDYDAVNDRPYIVMEYVSGPSLSKYLGALHKARKKLELPEINRILTGVAYALQYAHDGGVIHRDIKPGNVILTSRSKPVTPGEPLPPDFEPVLTDFGLVRFLNSSRQTSAGQTAGTPAYMSPEQARGETTDGRTDIYSLGIVLYEMLTGKVPFDGETTMSILLKHISDPPPPIPDISPSMQRVLDKALAKDREQRFQKPAEFARAFNSVVSAEVPPSTFMGIAPVADPMSVHVAEPVDSVIVVQTPRPRNRWLAVSVTTLALALIGVMYFVSTGATSPKSPTVLPTVSQPIPTTAQPPAAASSFLGSTAILHFRDGDAIMDQVLLEALAMPAPPAGSQYEAWLAGPAGRVSMGILEVDASGRGSLTYSAPGNENLFALYDSVEINLISSGASPGAEAQPAYTYTMPQDGLVYLRQLLVSSPNLPDQSAIIQALALDTQLLFQSASEVQNAHAQGDLPGARRQAEIILNLLAGSLSPDHKDWDGDGNIVKLGDGYGFLLNGNNVGHIQGIFAHADYIANSPGANQNMIQYSGEVKVCAENLAAWTSQLKEETLRIISARSAAEMQEPVQRAADLVEKMRFGDDLNGNLKSEPIPGECGVATTYRSAYAMADMPLLSIGLSGTPAGTGTPPASLQGTLAPTKGSGGGGGGAPEATKKPPPGQVKTDKPPGGGGGGGSGGGGNSGGNPNNP